MKKNTVNPFGFIVFILSFFWFRICAGYMITFRVDHEPILLYTREYLLDYITAYGGIADLFAQFITQFYISPWLGALALALIVTSFIYRAFSVSEGKGAPGILLWVLTLAFLTRTDGALTHIVAFSMVLGAINEQETKDKKTGILWLERFITLPILIWASGSWAWLYVVMVVFRDAFGERKFSAMMHVFVGYAAVLGLIAQQFIWPVTIKSMLFDGFPFDTYWGIALLVLGAGTMLYPRLPKKEYHTLTYIASMASMILFIVITIMAFNDQDRTTERWRTYIKNEHYGRIIKQAEKKAPDNRIQSLYLNYALAKEDRLLDDMFSFPQAYGPDGLIPDPSIETRDTRETGFIGYLYYETGNFDKARQIAADKSAFNGITPLNTKLLIKCLLSVGQTEAAETYLYQLKHTLFYRKWARRYTAMIQDPRQLNREFTEINKPELHRSSILSYDPADNLFTELLQGSLDHLTFNYLCAYKLLEKQPVFLVDNVWALKELGYKKLPRHYQEALMIYQLSHPNEKINLDGMKTDQETVTRVIDFGTQFSNDKQPVLANYQKRFQNMYLLYWFFTDNSWKTS